MIEGTHADSPSSGGPDSSSAVSWIRSGLLVLVSGRLISVRRSRNSKGHSGEAVESVPADSWSSDSGIGARQSFSRSTQAFRAVSPPDSSLESSNNCAAARVRYRLMRSCARRSLSRHMPCRTDLVFVLFDHSTSLAKEIFSWSAKSSTSVCASHN